MNDSGKSRELMKSPAYRKAYEDVDFLKRDELRPVRLQLELLKPEMLQEEHGIDSTIVVFGSARTPDPETARREYDEASRSVQKAPGDPAARKALQRAEMRVEHAHYYAAAREFSRIVSSVCQINGLCEFVVVTGGGPGIMEAANRGAHDVGAKSVGLNITLPFEQMPNPYITPELCFNFHYFAIRKMHFMLRAKGLVAFPGGYGTLDELFGTLTLIQTHKSPRIPVILYARKYWDRLMNFEAMVDEGVISAEDVDLIQYAETPDEAWRIIADFHAIGKDRKQ